MIGPVARELLSFLQLLFIPNGFFFPGQKFSGQFIVEVWTSGCLRACTFAGSMSHLCSHLSATLAWKNMMLSCSPQLRETGQRILGTTLPGFRSCNPPWLRLSQSWDHKPLRRQSLSPWQKCHLCPLHPAWP